MVTGDEPGGATESVSGPDKYRAPQGWHRLSAETRDEDLAAAATEWIFANAGFLVAQAGQRERDQQIAGDAMSLMIFRASRGQGLTESLRKHATGEERIEKPEAILLQHLDWVLDEERGRHRRVHRRERPTDPQDPSNTTLFTTPIDDAVDASDRLIDSALNNLINSLQDRFEEFLAARTRWPQLPEGKELDWAHAHLDEIERELLCIFRNLAPGKVLDLDRKWDNDQRRCVLFGVFPCKKPVRVVYWCRALRSRNTTRTISYEATEKMIGRLRKNINKVWPFGPGDLTGEVCDGPE